MQLLELLYGLVVDDDLSAYRMAALDTIHFMWQLYVSWISLGFIIQTSLVCEISFYAGSRGGNGHEKTLSRC